MRARPDVAMLRALGALLLLPSAASVGLLEGLLSKVAPQASPPDEPPEPHLRPALTSHQEFKRWSASLFCSGAEDGYIRLHHFDADYLDMKDPVPEDEPAAE